MPNFESLVPDQFVCLGVLIQFKATKRFQVQLQFTARNSPNRFNSLPGAFCGEDLAWCPPHKR